MNRRLRVAIVYDRAFPASHGGIERWFRLLSETLAALGHEVTYLTSDHWHSSAPPRIPGVHMVSLGKVRNIYSGGRRSAAPVVTYGVAVARYLLRHAGVFDVVHSTASTPVAAHAVVACAARGGYLPVLDWWEVWGDSGWRDYLGPVMGHVAARAESHLARANHAPVVFSRLHGAKLRSLRCKDDALFLRGVLPTVQLPIQPGIARPYVLMVNRLIPEKQTSAILPALCLVRKRVPDLTAVIVGTGPLEHQLQVDVARHGLSDAVSIRANLNDAELAGLMQEALCMVVLSRREGYGLVAVEAMRHGTPAVILFHPESAASERIVVGENGVLIPSLDPELLSSAILGMHAAGMPFRDSTLAWRKRHERDLTIEHSLPYLIARYQQRPAERRTRGWRNARP